MNRREFLKLSGKCATIAAFPIASMKAIAAVPSIANKQEPIILKLDYAWLGSGRLRITRMPDNVNEYVNIEITDSVAVRKGDISQGSDWSMDMDVSEMKMKINGKEFDFMERYNRSAFLGQSYTAYVDVSKL